MLQCRTVLASVPKCANPEGLKTDQDLPRPCQDCDQSPPLFPIFSEPPCDGGCAPKPCGISMSYWQPHNSGKGVPGGGGQAGSTEGPCPAPPQALSHLTQQPLPGGPG